MRGAGLRFSAHAKADPRPRKQVDQAPSTEPTVPEVTIRAQREAMERGVGTFVGVTRAALRGWRPWAGRKGHLAF
jgi:hypothetical protein